MNKPTDLSTTQNRWLPFLYLLLLVGMLIACLLAEVNRQQQNGTSDTCICYARTRQAIRSLPGAALCEISKNQPSLSHDETF